MGELFGTKEVVSVPASLPAVAAFAVMVNAGVSGVAVVADGGGGDAGSSSPPALVASLGPQDARLLRSPAAFDDLRLPCAEFAAKSRARAAAAAGLDQQPPPPPFVAVPPSATLRALVRALVAGRAHRAYIVDDREGGGEGGREGEGEGPGKAPRPAGGGGNPVGVVTLTDILRLLAVDPADDNEGWCSW